MNEYVFRRKLAAILDADVVGYTRLVQRDEDATLALFRAHISEAFEPAIAAHGGVVFKETGDGLLAEFDSVVEALQCAVEIQQKMHARNAEANPDFRMSFRIGINLGDLVHEKGDVFGDGVIVASRLQTIADAGGICVSDSVVEQVRHKLPISFVPMGRQRVKNVAEPVRAFRVDAEKQPRRSRGISVGPPGPARRWLWISGTAVVILIAAGFASRNLDYGWSDLTGEELNVDTATLSLPDKPSIAVLAFDNMSTDPTQDYFTDGITEDITTDLSKIPGLFVIARNSSFTYKGKKLRVQQIGRELGVKYILEGSIRRSGNNLRINAQLVDAQNGMHVWAEKFDEKIDDIFKVQDLISSKIVGALAVQLQERNVERSSRGTQIIAAYDVFLRGWANFRQGTRQSTLTALTEFTEATKLDPQYLRAHAAIAATYLAILQRDWFDIGENADSFEYRMKRRARQNKLTQKIEEHLKVAMAEPSPLALRVSAEFKSQEREYDQALQDIINAIVMDPNDADSYAQLGLTLTWAGRPAEAIKPLNKGMRLNPRHPALYLAYLGIAHFALEDFKTASRLLERSARQNPGDHWPLIHLLAAHGYLGNLTEARSVMSAVNELLTEAGHEIFQAKFARADMPYRFETDRLRLLVGLQKARATEYFGGFKFSPI